MSMLRTLLHSRVAIAAALAALPVTHGGWAVVTVQDLPEAVVVGRPTTLTYTVRQHGRTLLTGLRGRVTAEHGGLRVEVPAPPGESDGQYRATLTLTQAGAWTVTIHSGFGPSDLTLLPLPAVSAGVTAPVVARAEVGRRLFVAKGCVTCHRHDAVPNSGRVDVGPNLTVLRLDATFLSRFLADPGILPPDVRGQQMPDLGLAPSEIAALVAFITCRRSGGRAVLRDALRGGRIILPPERP
jgi:mono/diheme cytochrome c family protein